MSICKLAVFPVIYKIRRIFFRGDRKGKHFTRHLVLREGTVAAKKSMARRQAAAELFFT